MKNFILSISISILAFTDINCQTYNIVEYGAVADGKTLNTKSIQNTIDKCFENGGGTVFIPTGVFITGTIELKSNINLYLESGAILKGSPDIINYRFYQAPNYEASSHYGIIYTHKAENVSITGLGSIDGNDEVFFDWDKAKSIEWGGIQFTRQKEKYRMVTSGIGDGPVIPKERPRQMIIFSECKNVLVRDVMLVNSPFWTLHFADCDGVIVYGLKIRTCMETPNSDGIDITSSSNVSVSDCDIRTGDDAIAITGFAYHFELPGYQNIRHISENINISNCNLQSRSSGIRIGFLDQNSVRNIHISNINITNSNRGIGIFIRDEGSLENITISQVFIETHLHTGDWWGNGEPIHISAVRGKADVVLGKIKNVTFRDITCKGESGILLFGTEESIIENIQFNNLNFKLNNSKLNNVAGGNIDLRGCLGEKSLFEHDIPAFYAQYVKNLTLNNVEMDWGIITDKYYTYGIQVNNFDGLRINKVHTIPSPSNLSLPPIELENGKDLESDIPSLSIQKPR